MGVRKACLAMVGPVLAATPACADVLEVGHGGAVWVAGGPAGHSPAAYSATQSAPSSLTLVAPGAGPERWRGVVAALAVKYDLSPALLEALVWQESRWNPQAISPAGARGLAQLMPGTARMLGVDMHDSRANLEGGARYLRAQIDAFGGDIEKALAAYNAGPGRVRSAGGIPPIRETQAYVASVMGRLSAPVRR